jgi:hypothetical protein
MTYSYNKFAIYSCNDSLHIAIKGDTKFMFRVAAMLCYITRNLTQISFITQNVRTQHYMPLVSLPPHKISR